MASTSLEMFDEMSQRVCNFCYVVVELLVICWISYNGKIHTFHLGDLENLIMWFLEENERFLSFV